ncbi:hypothetical protein Dimus_003520 [Dionaea muscipula]
MPSSTMSTIFMGVVIHARRGRSSALWELNVNPPPMLGLLLLLCARWWLTFGVGLRTTGMHAPCAAEVGLLPCSSVQQGAEVGSTDSAMEDHNRACQGVKNVGQAMKEGAERVSGGSYRAGEDGGLSSRRPSESVVTGCRPNQAGEMPSRPKAVDHERAVREATGRSGMMIAEPVGDGDTEQVGGWRSSGEAVMKVREPTPGDSVVVEAESVSDADDSRARQ